jgi:hypothetical protein
MAGDGGRGGSNSGEGRAYGWQGAAWEGATVLGNKLGRLAGGES